MSHKLIATAHFQNTLAQQHFPTLCSLLEQDSASHRFLFYEKLKSLNLDTPENNKPRYSSLKTDPLKMRKSAVLMCFVTRPSIIPSPIRLLILQKTPKNVKMDSKYLYGGQPCFPGGTFDEGIDDTLRDTAIRETNEELGPVNGLKVCNESFPEALTGAGIFSVKTFIATFENSGIVPYQLQKEEIAHAFEIHFADILKGYDPKGVINYPGYGEFMGPMFNVTGLTCPTVDNTDPKNQSFVPLAIWGYTASIIEKFCRTLEQDLAQ